MFGGDPTHSGAGTGNPILSAKVLWNFSTPGEPIGCSAAVTNGMVYIGLSPDYSCIYTFNETNGQVIWRYKTADVITTPAVADGIVYVCANYSINALNAYNGNLLWKLPASFRVESSPTVANGIVYIGLPGYPASNFYALNGTNGAVIWNCTTRGEISTAPAVSGGVVYMCGGVNDYLYALNATSGVQIWNYTIGFIGSPAVAKWHRLCRVLR
jgi:eukaryotic-like serine/threonine-protein kinase